MNDTCERISVDIEELEARLAPTSFSYSYMGYSATGTITTAGSVTTVSGTLTTPNGTFSGTISFPATCS